MVNQGQPNVLPSEQSFSIINTRKPVDGKKQSNPRKAKTTTHF